MADITVNSHDVLGKLTVIKNHLAVVSEDDHLLSPQQREYVKRAMEANQQLIDQIKLLHESAHSHSAGPEAASI